METFLLAGLPLAECVAYVVGGRLLVGSTFFEVSDGESALRLASFVTLPAIILQTLSSVSLSRSTIALVLLVSVVHAAVSSALSWYVFSQRSPRERGVLTGSCVSLSLGTLVYPLVGKVSGINCLAVLMLFGLVSWAATHVLSYLLVASGGAAFPENYKHTDGGVYSGEWKGMRKEGLGTYAYPSGAAYSGEWRENTKEGFGVYTFKDGGAYEGEWSSGQREGVGVRTFVSGKVKAGRWRNGDLVQPLQLWQCSRAAEAAAETAEAAKKVPVGPGKASKAIEQLILQPAFWASVVGAALALCGGGGGGAAASGPFLGAAEAPLSSLPASIATITAPLAEAHAPLALLAAGMTLDTRRPGFRQMKDISVVLALRLCPLLALAAIASVAAPGVAPVIAIAAIGALAPIPRQVIGYAQQFRSNEAFAFSATRFSELLALPLVAAMLLAAAAAWPDVFCPWWVFMAPPGFDSALSMSSAPAPGFALSAVLVAAASIGAAAWFRRALEPSNRKRMVFGGDEGAKAASPASSTPVAATAAPEGASDAAGSPPPPPPETTATGGDSTAPAVPGIADSETDDDMPQGGRQSGCSSFFKDVQAEEGAGDEGKQQDQQPPKGPSALPWLNRLSARPLRPGLPPQRLLSHPRRLQGRRGPASSLGLPPPRHHARSLPPSAVGMLL